MEQAILEKSKGATYMSFVLDIDIVVKRDGKHANLAESKAKNKSHIPKKKDEETKKTTKIERDPQNNVSLENQNELNMHRMSMDSKNVFDKSLKIPGKNETSGEGIHEKVKKQFVPEESNIPSRVDITEDKILEEQSEMITNLQKPYHNAKIIPSKKHISKKRPSKIERKAKVFKAKIEPIDFLECNRIFMCNHLQMIRRGNRSSLKSCSHSAPNTATSGSKMKTLKCASLSLSNHKTKTVHYNRMKFSLPNKKIKFWRKNDVKLTYTPTVELVYQNNYSSGDFSTKETPKMYKRFFKNGCNITKHTDNYNRLCVNSQFCLKTKVSDNGFIPQFEKPIINIEPLSSEKIITDKEYHGFGCNYLQRNSLYKFKLLDNNEINKSQSVPNIIQRNLINLYSNFCRKHNPKSCEDYIIIEDSDLKQLQTKKQERHFLRYKKWKTLSDLKIKLFNNGDEYIIPQTKGIEEITNFNHNIKTCKFTQKKVFSTSAISNVCMSTQSIKYQIRSLENINKLYKENTYNKQQLEEFTDYLLQLAKERKTQIKFNKCGKNPCLQQKKGFWQVLYNLFFVCLTPQSNQTDET